jgi:hypothetical protein
VTGDDIWDAPKGGDGFVHMAKGFCGSPKDFTGVRRSSWMFGNVVDEGERIMEGELSPYSVFLTTLPGVQCACMIILVT